MPDLQHMISICSMTGMAPSAGIAYIGDALGDNLAAIAELGDDDLHSVQNFVDALITRARLKTLAGGSA